MAFGDLIETVIDEAHGGDSGDTLSVTFASAPSEGYLISLEVAAPADPSTPSGFSSVCAQADGSDDFIIYYKVAGASEGTTYSVTLGSSVTERCMIGTVWDGGTNGFDATPVDASKVDTKETGSSSVETDTSGSGLTTTTASCLLLAGGYLDVDANFVSVGIHGSSEAGWTMRGDAIGENNASGGLALALASRVVTSTGTFAPRFQIDPAVAHPYNYGYVVAFKEGSGGGGGGPSTPQGLHGIGQGINVQRSTRLGGELEFSHAY